MNFTADNKTKIRIMGLMLIISSVLLAIKFTAWGLTHSNAILSDALESIVNVVAGAFALYSVYYAAHPKDADHPYGHGKIEFLSASLEGGMITLAGLGMITKGIAAFFHADELKSLDVGVILTAAAGVVNFIIGRFLIRKGNRFNSALMVANGRHLVSDTVSSLGLILGLGLIYLTHLVWIDYVVAIAFGGVLIYTGVRLVTESITNLLDGADYEKLKQLIDLISKNRGEKWIDIHNLRVLKYGSHLHVDCHVTLPWYDSLELSHQEIGAIEQLVRENMDQEIEFFIHADPCIPKSCPICEVKECPYRQSAFVKRLDWGLHNALPNRKHELEPKDL